MKIRLRRKSSSERFPKRPLRVALAGEIDVFAARALCHDLDAITGSAVIDLTAVSL
ncbi:MAG: hypothetical protein IAI50_12610, partial [Candidatus Eremiobacteraeota bacterium]|nr:hypothetical protein [Candidatus Eremiobacteraeota bacterium]